jgi:hypothetical protein
MEIRASNRISASAATAAAAIADDWVLMRQMVAAISRLNRPELLEEDREYILRRRAGGRKPMVLLVDCTTGEIFEELSSEDVLRMADRETERDKEL